MNAGRHGAPVAGRKPGAPSGGGRLSFSNGGFPMNASPRVDLGKTNALLTEALLRHLPEEGKFDTAVSGMAIARFNGPSWCRNAFYKPLLGVIAQGAKRSLVGSEPHEYGANQCLLIGVDVPVVFQITDASPDKPHLAVSVELDTALLCRLTEGLPDPPEAEAGSRKGVSVADVDPDVLDAFLRLTELLDAPERIPVLAPLIVREIHYRVLTGPQGPFLRVLHTLGSRAGQIARAVTWMRSNYREQLNVARLASQVHMATSTFHHHFKTVTTLSPLQYHKRLRLHEARRLMLEEGETAGGACLAVGYESQSQFTREYKQVFGLSPRDDLRRLRGMALTA